MLFVRQDCVEAAWRIVEPYLKSDTPVYDFEPNSWGPAEVDKRSCPLEAGITRRWWGLAHFYNNRVRM
jgi:glucose-6-phosphate 1-dehydrogenase